MGDAQKLTLHRMSTGTFDRRGVSALTGIRNVGRVLESLTSKGDVEVCTTGDLTVYRRTKKGSQRIYNLNRWKSKCR